jgi:transaldolase/glucose-6-phosphate isomerase
VPAALIGLDLVRWVSGADAMAERCRVDSAEENPGVGLGLALGVAAREGKDKLTLIVSPRIYDMGAWLEQLVAESTGKNGTAIIPVDREPLGVPATYGTDRLFVYLRLQTMPDDAQDRAVESLVSAGASVLRIDVPDAYGLAAEFFRWEIATAVAGAVLGINPFDQPDVEASKIETRKLTDDVETTGQLPEESPVFADEGLTFFTDAVNAGALAALAGEATAAAWIRAHLSRLAPGDYLALLAYLPMTAAHERALTRIRTLVRDARRVATAVGFGPRFLHSTGQAYKGGPNTGVFLQITCEDAQDLPVPHAGYTFGVVKAAQARGDFQVLVDRRRRALRVHLGADVASGLHVLETLVAAAVAR